MGRAGRPSGSKSGFDPLRELHEEGLPDGWSDYWQGKKGVISDQSGDPLREIAAGRASDRDVLRALLLYPAEDARLLNAIWEGESKKLQQLQQSLASDTLSSFLQYLDKEELQRKWEADFRAHLAAWKEDPTGIPPTWSALALALETSMHIDLDREMRALYDRDSGEFRSVVMHHLLPILASDEGEPHFFFRDSNFALSRDMIVDTVIPPWRGMRIDFMERSLQSGTDFQPMRGHLVKEAARQRWEAELFGNMPSSSEDHWKRSAKDWILESLRATTKSHTKMHPAHLHELVKQIRREVGGGKLAVSRKDYEAYIRGKLDQVSDDDWKRFVNRDISLEDLLLP